jgi:hypothetical protein
MSSIKIVLCRSDPLTNMASQAILVSDWPISIDASFQVSVHLAKQFQRRFLEIDQSETRIACGGHVC